METTQLLIHVTCVVYAERWSSSVHPGAGPGSPYLRLLLAAISWACFSLSLYSCIYLWHQTHLVLLTFYGVVIWFFTALGVTFTFDSQMQFSGSKCWQRVKEVALTHTRIHVVRAVLVEGRGAWLNDVFPGGHNYLCVFLGLHAHCVCVCIRIIHMFFFEDWSLLQLGRHESQPPELTVFHTYR